jgi:hypothetical protein
MNHAVKFKMKMNVTWSKLIEKIRFWHEKWPAAHRQSCRLIVTPLWQLRLNSRFFSSIFSERTEKEKINQNVQESPCHDWLQWDAKQKGQVLAIIYQIIERWDKSVHHKFWIFSQRFSFPLTGSEDIRAHERPTEYRRPFLLYDEPDTAAARIHTVGYRYLPVHRETYGYSPRPIYPHHYPHYSYKERKWIYGQK